MAFLKAISKGNFDFIRDNIEEFSTIDSLEQYRLLNYAIQNRKPDIAKYLIKNDCPVNDYVNPHTRHNTPLHNAVVLGDFKLLCFLIRKGAKQNLKNEDGYTPLHIAFQKERRDITNLLIQRSKNLYITDDYNLSNLHIACAFEKLGVLAELSEKFELDVNSAVSAESPSWPGYTPLHFAVESLKIESIKWLLERNADINAADSKGTRPLHIAFRIRNYALLHILACRPEVTFVNCADRYNLSYFHIFSATNYHENIRALLNNGCVNVDLNAQVNDGDPLFAGNTAVHFAIKYKCREAAEVLLQNNVDYTIQNSSGSTALHLAFESENEPFAQLLLDYQYHFFKSNPVDNIGISHFHILCVVSSAVVVRNFVKVMSIDVNTKVYEKSKRFPGCTALQLAIEYHKIDVVKELLRLGADPNLRDSHGLTALHWACRMDSFKVILTLNHTVNWNFMENLQRIVLGIIRMLYKHKACFRMKDNNGRTPLFYIYNTPIERFIWAHRHLSQEDFVMVGRLLNWRSEMLKEFKSYGADLQDRDKDGNSLVHIFVKHYSQTARYWTLEIGKFLRLGFNLNAKNNKGATPLLVVASLPDSDTFITPLLDLGADPNIIDGDGFPILHRYAFGLSKKRTMQPHFGSGLADLLRYGINVNSQLNDGRNIMHVAFSNKSSASIRFCDVVLSFYNLFDLNAIDSRGRTALHYASHAHSKGNVEYLLRQGVDIDILDNEGKTPFDFCNEKNCEATRVLLRYVEKMEKLGCYLSVENQNAKRSLMRLVQNKSALTVDENAEKKELDSLKEFRLNQLCTAYDILFARPSKLAAYARSAAVQKMIRCPNIDELFPNYGGLVKRQFRKGWSRSLIMEQAKAAVAILAGFNLPDICCEHITDCLDDKSIKNLLEAVNLHPNC